MLSFHKAPTTSQKEYHSRHAFSTCSLLTRLTHYLTIISSFQSLDPLLSLYIPQNEFFMIQIDLLYTGSLPISYYHMNELALDSKTTKETLFSLKVSILKFRAPQDLSVPVFYRRIKYKNEFGCV